MNRHFGRVAVDGLTVAGESTGGVRTSVNVKELGVVFDIGCSPMGSVRMPNLLLTHAHPDHIGALINYLGTRQLYGMPTARVFTHHAIADYVSASIAHIERLQGKYRFNYELVVAKPGEDVEIRRNLVVRPFSGRHVVPTLGYVLVEKRAKLNPEFAHLPGAEIGRLRRANTPGLFSELEVPLIAYPGDSLIEVLDADPLVTKARVLLLESTFLDETKPASVARLGGHIHLDHIIEAADKFENQHIVLLHFSQIYRPREVFEIVQRRLPNSLLERISLLSTVRKEPQ